MLTKWINKEYIDPAITSELLCDSPFSHIVINNFFNKEKIIEFLKALSEEEFIAKETDLFSLKQTNDLASSQNKTIQLFRNFLISENFVNYLNTLMKLKVVAGKIDLAGTLYEDTDHLLCHDDQLEGRKIAFLLYLSTMKHSDGGNLNLLNQNNNKPTEVAKKIIPAFNTLCLFEVSNISFHEVEEVIVDKQRIALGGWYHG